MKLLKEFIIMNYNISSDEFDNLLIKELLEKLSRYFEKEKLSFYVIGATARDIIMQKLLQQRSARHTQDLDIAIAIADWQKFEEISNGIAQMDGFEKSLSQKQRFYYKKVYEIPKEDSGGILEYFMRYKPRDISLDEEEIGKVVERIYSDVRVRA